MCSFNLNAWCPISAQPYLADSVRYLRLRPSCEASAQNTQKIDSTPNNRFGPSVLCEPTMPSADFSRLIPSPLDDSSPDYRDKH